MCILLTERPVTAVNRLRLAVKKDGALQFLSHLDFARVVRYVIIRAGLPICYSEGFNPHMKINFASALGVGVAADREYMDMELQEPVPPQEVIDRMNRQAPDGFAVLDGHYVAARAAKLKADAKYAVYDLAGPLVRPLSQAELDAILQAFNGAPTVTYKKVSPKGKRAVRLIEVKRHIVEPLSGTAGGGSVTLRAGIFQTSEGAIKPSQLWEVLGEQFCLPVHTDMMLARRRGLFRRDQTGNHSLFAV